MITRCGLKHLQNYAQPEVHFSKKQEMRHSKTVELNDPEIRNRLLAWASRKTVCCVLNSNVDKQLFVDSYSKFDFIVAVDVEDEIILKNDELISDPGTCFDLLKHFHEQKKDWLFGFLTYDLKNENSYSGKNSDELRFPDLHFFQPQYILKVKKGNLHIDYLASRYAELSVQKILDEIMKTRLSFPELKNEIHIQQKVSKPDYVSTVEKIKKHIQRGDVYEMNYCVEFFAEDAVIHPLEMYLKLNEISPMPFSCFYRMNDHYLICASPERFIAKRENKIISQPIKGTARRGKTNEEDDQIKNKLKNDPKELSENVMIVDLVRNDLARTASKGSVQVEELSGIYTFRQLHQMISTVVSEMRNDVHFTEVINHAFPMGSMTGAPKIRAMQLIEQYETTKRSLYSGSVGYISPDGDFDFNVVIRTILYNADKKYLSFMVGSAITANSVPEQEYDECLLKANAMLKILKVQQPVTVNH